MPASDPSPKPSASAPAARPASGKALPHLVFGGELVRLDGTEFRDLSQLDLVGVFPDYASAARAWKAKAQASVDNAHMRYFIVHLHRLLDPSAGPQGAAAGGAQAGDNGGGAAKA